MTKTYIDYESEIIALHNELIDYPDSKTLQDKLSRRLTSWVNKLSIVVSVASNEQSPWTSEEMGFPCIPMAKKSDTGYKQVGDYHFFVDEYSMIGGLCVERKGTTREKGRLIGCDLYSTISNKSNRRRFFVEIARSKADSRFGMMELIAECSYGEFLYFKPQFNGKQFNRSNYGMSVAARRATIAKIEALGVHVFFAGTRQAAVGYFHDLVLQWCRAHYRHILKI